MDDVRGRILEENIRLHRIEAPVYERLHPELYNWFEQSRISREISFIVKNLPRRSNVLDIGCGTGNILLKFLREGVKAWGVDISPDMLDILRKRLPKDFNDSVDLIESNADDFIKNCGMQFDIIAMSSVLHHVPDYEATLGAAIDILKPGGWLYITHEPTKANLSKDPLPRKILWQIDNIIYIISHPRKVPATEHRDYRFSDYHLYHGFDEEKVLERCRASGMEIIKMGSYSSTMRLGISCWVDSNILKSKRQFSIIARKI